MQPTRPRSPDPTEAVHRFHKAALAIVAVLGVLLYGNTLAHPFVFDDYVYLLNNPLVKDPHSFGFPAHFAEFVNFSRRAGLDPDLSINFVLRPVSYFTFYLNYWMDGMKPPGFRVVNILIHCVNAFLLFQIIFLILRTSPLRGSLSFFSTGFIALTSAILFLVHPLQIESVTYVVQRFTSIGAFFYLLTLLTHLLSAGVQETRRARIYRGLSVSSLILGMLSKETVFTAPFLIVIVDGMVMGTPWKVALKRAIPHLLCLPIIPAIVFATSQATNTGDATPSAMIDIVNFCGYSRAEYALTELSVVVTYLRLILIPMGLNLDWDYPLSTSLLQGKVLLAVALIATIVGSTWGCYRRKNRGVRQALMFCGVLWYFLGLIVSSSIVPLPDLMAEHRVYFASIGALTALACGLDLLRTRFLGQREIRYLMPGGVVAWILMLSLVTIDRNRIWSSDIRLWEDCAYKSPRKARTWFNLAGAYYVNGRMEDAERCNRKAIALAPGYVSAYVNLATIEILLGRDEAALEVAQAGLQVAPGSCELHYCTGVAFAGLRNAHASIEAINRALTINPRHRRSHLVLANIYHYLNRNDEALNHFRIAAKIRPLEPEYRQTVSLLETALAQDSTGERGQSGQAQWQSQQPSTVHGIN